MPAPPYRGRARAARRASWRRVRTSSIREAAFRAAPSSRSPRAAPGRLTGENLVQRARFTGRKERFGGAFRSERERDPRDGLEPRSTRSLETFQRGERHAGPLRDVLLAMSEGQSQSPSALRHRPAERVGRVARIKDTFLAP